MGCSISMAFASTGASQELAKLAIMVKVGFSRKQSALLMELGAPVTLPFECNYAHAQLAAPNIITCTPYGTKLRLVLIDYLLQISYASETGPWERVTWSYRTDVESLWIQSSICIYTYMYTPA